MLLLLCLLVLLYELYARLSTPGPQPHYHRIKHASCPARNRRKPEWVKKAIIKLKAESDLSCYKLAASFNRLYAAKCGVSVGKTLVTETVKAHAYEIAQRRERWKRRILSSLPRNAIWGVDMTGKGDQQSQQHSILGILDHGSRMALAVLTLPDRSTLTLLKWLITTVETYGKPKMIRTDNEACFTSQRFALALRLMGIRHQRTQLGHPWQNGHIERLFGTLKEKLDTLEIINFSGLQFSLAEFRFWQNEIHPHQHLDGWTPMDAWHGCNPYQQPPRSVRFFSVWEGLLTGYYIRR